MVTDKKIRDHYILKQDETWHKHIWKRQRLYGAFCWMQTVTNSANQYLQPANKTQQQQNKKKLPFQPPKKRQRFPKQCGNTWGSYGNSKSRGG